MIPTLAAPLAPFVDALPVPQRLVAALQNGWLSVPIRAGVHRFHRDLPESAIWGYDGRVPGPTIEAERGQPVTVQWRPTKAIHEIGYRLPKVRATDDQVLALRQRARGSRATGTSRTVASGRAAGSIR